MTVNFWFSFGFQRPALTVVSICAAGGRCLQTLRSKDSTNAYVTGETINFCVTFEETANSYVTKETGHISRHFNFASFFGRREWVRKLVALFSRNP